MLCAPTRCTRSCFQCPICIAPLTVTNVETPSSGSHLAVPEGASAPSGSYILTCSYCQWSSTEIGIKFDKANGLYGQLAKVRNGGKPRLTPKDIYNKRHRAAAHHGSPLTMGSLVAEADSGDSRGPASSKEPAGDREEGLDVESQFTLLKQFYQRQMAEASGTSVGSIPPFGETLFGSPATLSRIMNMFTSPSGASLRMDNKAQPRIRNMREALDQFEGFRPATLDESAAIARLHGGGEDSTGSWDMTASAEQRAAQAAFVGEEHMHGRARFVDQLRPIPFLLRTKRSKRCPVCRHILSKPEAKSTNSRFRIRLIASSYVPSISIQLLQAASVIASAMASGSRTSMAAAAAAPPPTNILEPLKPVQYVLTFRNPIFEHIKVTLATPSATPGRFSSKVTILCPQFEIASNTDMWDDALRDSTMGAGSRGDAGEGGKRGDEGGQPQVVAGKIWDRGRNWVSIVVEVVPPSLSLDVLAMTSQSAGGSDTGAKVDLSPLREDEDIVEIPMSIRVEWETDAGQDGVGAAPGKDKDAKEKRELSYWCVLGIGRIRHD